MYTTEIHFIKTGNIPKIDKSLFKNNTLLLQRLLIDTEYGNWIGLYAVPIFGNLFLSFFLVKDAITTVNEQAFEDTIESWLLTQLLLKEANGNFVFKSIAFKLQFFLQ